MYKNYPPSETVPEYDEYSVQIDGETVPTFQIDMWDEKRIVSVDVAGAVGDGFDFENIWRCKSVSVETPEESFDATITGCSIEHGCAAISLEPSETVRDSDDNCTGGSRE